MNPLTVGVSIAAVFAGPSLYSLVESGGLDSETAVFRGLIVVVAVAFGVRYILGLTTDYAADAARRAAAYQAPPPPEPPTP